VNEGSTRDGPQYHGFGLDLAWPTYDTSHTLQILADRIGMELSFEDSDGTGPNKRELFRIHEGVAQLYARILKDHESGEAGRSYLASRNLKAETVADFQMGFAPDRFDALEKWAAQHKIPVELMIEAGVMARSERGTTYDRFRKRLMFPIRDEAGRVIGFSGRLIDPNDKGGKYVNSPETPLFRKSRVLFGIDKARRAMADKRTAIVVEGQLDAIRCHEAGISNVVASQGTALTSDHARIVRRYADEVILVLDADAAGQKAALRSSEAFVAEELSVRVASLPVGEDPDSLILSQGADVFLSKVNAAVSALDFLIDCSARAENLNTDAGMLRTTRSVQGLIACAPGAIQRDRMIQRASERLNLSPVALRRDMARQAQKRPSPRSAEPEAPVPAPPLVNHPEAEVSLAQLLCLYPEKVFPIVADHLPPDYITDPDCRLLIELMLDDPNDLMGRLPEGRPNLQKLAVQIQMKDSRIIGKAYEPTEAAQGYIIRLWRHALERRRKAISQGEERAEITMRLLKLDEGWAHAVDFMVV